MKRFAAVTSISVIAGLGVLAVPSAAVADSGIHSVNAAPVVHSRPLLRADTSDFSFESFEADYLLERDAKGLAVMRVVETIVALFPDYDQNRGILRDIPNYYGDSPLDLSDITVSDENGNDVYFEKHDVSGYDSYSKETSFLELALGTDEYVHGRTTYVISYTAHNVIGSFNQTGDTGDDELYWDINGIGWAQSFGRVSVMVHVDPSLVGALTGNSRCYWGYSGSDAECEISESDDRQTFEASVTELAPSQTVTIAIGFSGGTFTQPVLAKNSWIITKAPLWLLFAALALLIFAMVVRYGFWNDAKGRGIIIPEYTAPDDDDLLIAGDLIERQGTALAAQFVDLAVRGFVSIVDTQPGGSDYGSTDRFALDFVTNTGATEAELKVLNILFGGSDEPGERVHLGSLDASVGASLYGQRTKGRQHSIDQKLRARPAGNVDKWLRRIGGLVMVGYVAIFAWTIATDVDAAPVFGFGIASAVILLVVSGLLSKPYLLTDAGAEKRDYLLGLRDYLELAEEDRLHVLQSPSGADRVVTADKRAIVTLNEKLLPYAVLWGVEREWSKQLQVQYEAAAQAPSWTTADLSRVDLAHLVSNFSLNSTSMVRPLVSTSSGSSGGSSWSSSGGSSFSSGSSGGGFSGGGGGGGGGGGR